jgi:serine/threonine protein kinase
MIVKLDPAGIVQQRRARRTGSMCAINNDQEEWGVLESLFLKGEQLTTADREVLLQERSASDHLRSRLWALWRQGDRTESFLAANVLSNFTVFADGRTGADEERYQPGQLLARRFEIQEFLGEGGMGSVYRARDTTLGRVVALKILQWSGVGEEIRQRADREAHVISALNHPGICTLFDMYWDRTTPILVMECLHGETLEQRLTRGPLTPEEFRTIGLQTCEALTYAHERRVLHGDLKPANIMLTERGAVLLDFGLSRSIGEPAAGDQEDGQAASRAVPQGWVAGTPAYMSPEQIRGQALDARSDIFSLGCVLYKMVSGKGPFHRNSTEDTFQAILKAVADPPAAQLAGVPRRVRSLITKCLRLDPADRFQSVTEIAKSLRRATSSTLWAQLTVAGLLLICATISSAVWFGTRHEDPPLTMRQLTFDDGVTTDPTLSRDGNTLAFASDRSGRGYRSIWVQQLGSRQPRQLTNGACDEGTPTFSAGGNEIAFHSKCNDSIYVVPTAGGTATFLAKDGMNPQFSPDGKWIAFERQIEYLNSDVVIMPASGGPAVKTAKIRAVGRPTWRPDSSGVVAAGFPPPPDDRLPDSQAFDWFFIAMDGSRATPLGVHKIVGLGSDGAFPQPIAWRRQRLIYGNRVHGVDDLWELRIRWDRSWQIVSKPKRLKTGIRPDWSASLAGSRLVFAGGDGHYTIGMLHLNPNVPEPVGKLERIPGARDAYFWNMSRDGRQITYEVTNDRSYLRSLETGKEQYFEFSKKEILFLNPVGGSKVVFAAGSVSASYRDMNVYLMDAATKSKDVLCTGCLIPRCLRMAGGYSRSKSRTCRPFF